MVYSLELRDRARGFAMSPLDMPIVEQDCNPVSLFSTLAPFNLKSARMSSEISLMPRPL